MKTLHIAVVDKIATYQQRDGEIVCGNNDYVIEFAFDSEWDGYTEKVARFIINGHYENVNFSGNTCPVPIIINTTSISVGVYAGNLCTTTPAIIGCKKSILCMSQTERESPAINGDSAFIRYSAHKDGTDFTETWHEGQIYIGFTTAQSAPIKKEDYTWCAVYAGADGLITTQDKDGNNVLYLTQAGEVVGGGVILPQGGGTGSGNGSGGGGSNNNATLTVANTTGWISKSISEGADCEVSFSWSSLEGGLSTGNGALVLTVGGSVKSAYEITQGDHIINVSKFLAAGTNKVQIEISDTYGNTRIISFSITCVAISLSSYFDGTQAYTGQIPFTYTPVGSVDKTVHFIVDGKEIGTQTVTVSNREMSYTIPAQAHGSHTLEVYFTSEIDGQTVESNCLFYDLICYEARNSTPIISVPFKATSVKQYSTVAIPYIVYTPEIITSAVELKDGTNTVATLTVDRKQQIWSYKALNAGSANLSIVCGDTTKPISFSVAESEIEVNAETANLELFLSSAGRSNNEENPLDWSSGSVKAELTGFNLSSDGWKLDADNNVVLRVSGDARVHIPFNIFGSDFRGTGKTIEFEFATRDVLNYDAVILSAWSGERGIKITAQKALLKSEQSEIYTQYKENETVRVAFTVEKKAENRLLAIYINGIMSGVVQYPEDDDFSQTNPVGISIGSNDCTTDIYCIRVYSNNLTRYQILDNWIADTQNVEAMIERYTRNDIFDAYGNIVADKIPSYLPYMVLNVTKYSDLPQSKGDKKTVSGSYIDPLNAKRSFTFEGAEIDVQGTSSQYYSRKNYKIKFNGGFVTNGKTSATYQLRDNSMPTNEFTYKADVASSEGANNVELARLYDDTCPVKTPPQLTDSRVRQGIEGYPMLMFYGEGNNLTFLGKYNFNNDKGTEEVFGFKSGDESWEILQNNTEMVIWKDDNFTGNGWKTSFEGRYPDKNTDTTNLAAFSSWLKSTDTTAVTSESEKAARLAKFKNEFANWCNVDAMLFNYIFTEMFLMVDNRAKNAFPTRYDADGKWLILPYDYDTAIGINNEGELKFGYELEDIDLINGNNVYNGQDSVLYVNMRLAFADEIMAMYKTLRTGDIFSYEEIERRFEEHQSVWGEAVFNEDARFKYIDPLVNEGNKTYLPMLQGSKAEQRKWWLYNRFRYLDSKYNAGDALEDYIMLRSYAVADIEVTPYADIYATAKFDSALVQKRALRGNTYTLENPLSGGRDAVISVYSASQLSSIGDLSGLKVGMADFSKAVKLSNLKVGDSTEGYDNPNLTDLTIGNLTLLRTLDVRNCSALTQAVDISGCTNIENVYFDGTATTGVTLPNGGILKVLHLPSTVTNLTILNQKQITDFTIPSFANVSTLRIENTPIVDTLAALNAIQANSRVRLIGVDWTMQNASEILALMDKLDTFRGLDERGNNVDKAVVSGTIHVDMVTSDDLTQFAERYPNVAIDYERIGNAVTLMVDGEVFFRQVGAVGDAIIVPATPIKESTAQYHFAFDGWSLDGTTITDIPSVIGESSLTYTAVFTEVLRTYTVRFYNESALLQSASVAYGELPIYTGFEPTKGEGYKFSGWNPEIAIVTGDADYYAQFAEVRPLEQHSWNEISAISAEGTAANYFSIGDTKSVTLKGTVGTLELDATYNVYIIGFDHNEEIEGKGIHFGTFKTTDGKDICLVDGSYQARTYNGEMLFNMNHWAPNESSGRNSGGWAGCDLRYDILGSTDIAPSGYGTEPATDGTRVGYDASTFCATIPVNNTLMAALPAELRAVMKPMTKYTDNRGWMDQTEEAVSASIDYLPLLAEFEIFGQRKHANTYAQNKQKQYDYYSTGNIASKYNQHGNRTYYWIRSAVSFNANNFALVGDYGNNEISQCSTQSNGIAPIFKV